MRAGRRAGGPRCWSRRKAKWSYLPTSTCRRPRYATTSPTRRFRQQEHFGTVGLWCLLHGEAFFEPGLHHLECRFDFDAARTQFQQAGIRVMKPFTDLPYLKQAFTEGELWPLDARRREAALAAGAITRQQAEQFRRDGVLGSHLEILQRDEGYKGFNPAGINAIIRATDPRQLLDREVSHYG